MKQRPIGILDSGIGGLSIWQELVSQLPHEAMVYVADSAYCPYGSRDAQNIYELSRRIVQYLIQTHNVKLVVIACNTVTVSALDRLRADFPQVPIVGIVPVIKTAAEKSKNKEIGILSTQITAQSTYQKHLIASFAHSCVVTNVGTNDLVPLVENGEIQGEKTRKILAGVLKEFQEVGVDTIALGCSHFPFLRTEIQKILGRNVQLLDSAGAVARQVHRILEKNKQEGRVIEPVDLLYTTGEKNQFISVANKLVGDTMAQRQITIDHIDL